MSKMTLALAALVVLPCALSLGACADARVYGESYEWNKQESWRKEDHVQVRCLGALDQGFLFSDFPFKRFV